MIFQIKPESEKVVFITGHYIPENTELPVEDSVIMEIDGRPEIFVPFFIGGIKFFFLEKEFKQSIHSKPFLVV